MATIIIVISCYSGDLEAEAVSRQFLWRLPRAKKVAFGAAGAWRVREPATNQLASCSTSHSNCCAPLTNQYAESFER